MSKLIIDISHHHPVKNWDKLQKNVDLLITKATEGSTFIDNYLGTIVNECEKRKIPYFLYHYLHKGNVEKQIEFYVNTVKNVKGKYFRGYCLDVEENNSVNEVQNAINSLNKKVKDKCMLYFMYADFEKYKKIKLPNGNKWIIWEARYGKNTRVYSKKYPCHAIASLHQYCSIYTADWINGGIDVNRLTGKTKLDWFTSGSPAIVAKDSTAVKDKTHFKKCSKNETSLVDALKKNGYASTYSYRNQIALVNGIKNYAGTAKQNATLLDKMKLGKLCKPLL